MKQDGIRFLNLLTVLNHQKVVTLEMERTGKEKKFVAML
jgi:hypothetical protein